LKRRIQGRDSDDSDVGSNDEELDAEMNQIVSQLDDAPQTAAKGVFAMKFMKTAMEARRNEAKDRVVQMQQDLADEDDLRNQLESGDGSLSKAHRKQDEKGIVAKNNPGRMQFGAVAVKKTGGRAGRKNTSSDESDLDESHTSSSTKPVLVIEHSTQVVVLMIARLINGSKKESDAPDSHFQRPRPRLDL
jgi:hypothetical protein